MNPILHFLDWLIRRHGDLLTALFVYIGLPLTAWFLGRRSGRKKRKRSNTFVLVIRPPGKTLSAASRWTFESDDEGTSPFG
jgi:nicotinamide riboside transporter PnuC